MANGLDIYAAQNIILAYLDKFLQAAGYEVHEADIADAVTREYVGGVNQTTCVIQFGSMLPLAGDKSFCGPELDGYYSLVRVMSIASSPSSARQANSLVNQIVIGFRDTNVGSINVEGGGGAFALGESNTRPLAYGLLSSFKFATNLTSPGSTVTLPVVV